MTLRVELKAEPADEIELRFEEIDVVFLVRHQLLEQVACHIVLRGVAVRRGFPLYCVRNGESGRTMFDLKIPEVNDVIVGELAERGEWVVANVQTGATWPVNSQKVPYRGEAIWIMPVMTEYFPAVAMKVPPGKGRAECERLLLRFLSTLSWVLEAGFLVGLRG
jgi:hypothetical protein